MKFELSWTAVRCGTSISSAASFCTNCGAKLEGRCSNCGALLNESAKFCVVCGTQIQPPLIAVQTDVSSANTEKDRNAPIQRTDIAEPKGGLCSAVFEGYCKKNKSEITKDEGEEINTGRDHPTNCVNLLKGAK